MYVENNPLINTTIKCRQRTFGTRHRTDSFFTISRCHAITQLWRHHSPAKCHLSNMLRIEQHSGKASL